MWHHTPIMAALMTQAQAPPPPTKLGPRYEYVNPQGVLFHAFEGTDIAILKLAEELPKS